MSQLISVDFDRFVLFLGHDKRPGSLARAISSKFTHVLVALYMSSETFVLYIVSFVL